MSNEYALTRREFMQTGLAVVSTVGTVPAFLGQSGLVIAAENPASQTAGLDQRILVVVQLSGGNDGLNAVVPYGDSEYYNARPGIGVKENDVLAVDRDAGVGLNPQLVDLKAMMDEGRAAIVQAVGYPNPNRSHFASMDVWHTGDTLGGRGYGWVGKTMDQFAAEKRGKMDDLTGCGCVCIGSQSPLAAQGKQIKPVAFERAPMFQWSGSGIDQNLARVYQRNNMAEVKPGADDPLAFVMRTSMNAQVASDRVRRAVAKGTATKFAGGPLANQLKMVAAMIRAGLPTRVYYVSLGGFDTHANQFYSHGQRLSQFASAMRSFYEELEAIGEADRVLAVGFSEFGRRVKQNASNGTDHGAAGPMFLFGPMVRGGLIGQGPSLTELDKNGDLVYRIDFRSVYAGVLDNWLGVDSGRVLGQRYQPVEVLRSRRG